MSELTRTLGFWPLLAISIGFIILVVVVIVIAFIIAGSIIGLGFVNPGTDAISGI